MSKITIVTIDLSFHRAASAVVQSTLRTYGVESHELLAPHEEAFSLLRERRADMLCSAWLPSSHGQYLGPFETEVEKLAVMYRPYALWGVPDYVPQEAVDTLADLARPEVAERMNKRIQGIGPGAGISRFSRDIVARYGLDKAGYAFENGTLEDCTDAFENAVKAGQWVVVPLWAPQYLHERYRIRELKDPDGLLGGVDDATLILRKDALHRLPPDAVAALRELTLGNAQVSRLDHQLMRDAATPSS
ncbi:glycine betaine ABC transporter substrate-binding protein [Burkholderia gladioli]|uniref:glycine betaine ABC transporter substrate-binding protein n=2 Tax=Burkholderia gladioli TaxID=28095 RepID=UPI000F52B8A2|nr:glycine betaine ABC transporter substrate-binding protein [Burkholderia gladioli]